MWVTKQLTVAIDFHGMKKMQYNTMATMNCLVSNNLQNIVFSVQQREIAFNVTKKPFTSSVLAPDLLPVYFTSVFSTVHHWFYANDTLLVKYDLQSVSVNDTSSLNLQTFYMETQNWVCLSANLFQFSLIIWSLITWL